MQLDAALRGVGPRRLLAVPGAQVETVAVGGAMERAPRVALDDPVPVPAVVHLRVLEHRPLVPEVELRAHPEALVDLQGPGGQVGGPLAEGLRAGLLADDP